MKPPPDMGLPSGDCRVTTLLYNAPARALVAVVDPMPHAWGRYVRRIYVRRVEEDAYRQVEMATPETIPAEVVSCVVAPMLFINTERQVGEPRGGGVGGYEARTSNPGGILRVNLPEATIEPVTLDPAVPNVPSIIMSLIGVAPNGEALHVLGQARVDAVGRQCTYRYGLFEISLVSGSARLVTEMPGIFA